MGKINKNNISLVPFIVGIECCIMMLTKPHSYSERAPLLPFFLISLFYLVYLLAIFQSARSRKYWGPLATGVGFRLLLLLWDIYCSAIFTLPNSGVDSVSYYLRGVNYAAGVTSKETNFWLISGIMVKLFGASRLYNQFIIVLFSVLTLHITASILDMMDIQFSVRRFSMWLLCLLPNFAVLSSIYLRESLIILLLTMSCSFFLKWTKYGKKINLFLAFCFVLAGSYFHGGCIALAGGYAVVVAMYKRRKSKLVVSTRTGFLIAFFFLAFAFLYANFGSVLFMKIAGVESISDIGFTSTRGEASYAQYVGDSRNVINLIVYTPLRILFFLFSPFPIFWRGISDVIAFLFNALFYLFVWIKMLKTIVKHPDARSGYVMMFILILFCVCFVFAWGVTNSGTALRHRDKVVTLYIIALALCLNYENDWKPNWLGYRIKI